MWLKQVHHEVSLSGNKHTPFIINHLSCLSSIYHVSFYDTCMNIYYLSCIHLRYITRTNRHNSTLSSTLFSPLLTSDTLTTSITLGLSLTPLSTLGISDWSDDYIYYIIYISLVFVFNISQIPLSVLKWARSPMRNWCILLRKMYVGRRRSITDFPRNIQEHSPLHISVHLWVS